MEQNKAKQKFEELYKEIYNLPVVQNLFSALTLSEDGLEGQPEIVQETVRSFMSRCAEDFAKILGEEVGEASGLEKEVKVTVAAHHVNGYDVPEHEEVRHLHPEQEAELGAYILEMQEIIKQQQERISDLENQNSSKTSHWPSSKERYPGGSTYRDGKTKAHEPGESSSEEDSGTEPPKRGRGGVMGHTGYMAIVDGDAPADKTIRCYPTGWSQEEIDQYDWTEGPVHSVVTLKTVPEITQYVQMIGRIPSKRSKTGFKTVEGNFPAQARSILSYGEELKQEIVIDNVIGLVSMKRISDILKNRFGLTISPSTVNNILKSSGQDFAEASQKIADALKVEAGDKNTVFNVDETSVNVDGRNYWDHTVVSSNFVHHQLSPSRGLKGTYSSGILKNFKGTVVSDFWKNYLNREFDNCFCWAHLERDLAAAAKRDPESEWVRLMQEFAKESYNAYMQAKDNHAQIPGERLEGLLKLYSKSLEAGEAEEKSGKLSQKSRALLKRFTDYEDGILAHVYDTYLPRTNNDAERQLRMLKKKLDVSGVFRSEEGARLFLNFRTVIDTANRQGINPFEAIDEVLAGNTGYLITHDKEAAKTKTTPAYMKVVSKSGDKLE